MVQIEARAAQPKVMRGPNDADMKAPKAGPMMKPRPKAAMTRPTLLARSAGGVMSVS